MPGTGGLRAAATARPRAWRPWTRLVDDAEARTVFLLDTARHRWERVQVAGEPPAGHIGHATIISDDRVYVFGGLAGGFERRGAAPYSRRLSQLAQRSSPPSWSAVMADEGSAAEQPPPRRDARRPCAPREHGASIRPLTDTTVSETEFPIPSNLGTSSLYSQSRAPAT